MRIKTLVLMILIFCLLFSSTLNASLPYRLLSIDNKYGLKVEISRQYKTEVFDEPFGRDDLPNKGFLVDEENGGMTNKKGVKGEYAYLGYNYHNDAIPNDRYFSNIDRRGKVFDQNYTNVVWQDMLPEAPLSWDKIKKNTILINYILTTNFYDDDHITAGKTDTGERGQQESLK